LDDYLKLICFLSTSVYSALGVSAIMRYINRRFTYLLTYLLVILLLQVLLFPLDMDRPGLKANRIKLAGVTVVSSFLVLRLVLPV